MGICEPVNEALMISCPEKAELREKESLSKATHNRLTPKTWDFKN